MILQLLSLLDASSDKRVSILDHDFGKKKPPRPSKKLKRKLCVELIKKGSKLDKKTRKENRGEIESFD